MERDDDSKSVITLQRAGSGGLSRICERLEVLAVTEEGN
jgi:hypothetical protein